METYKNYFRLLKELLETLQLDELSLNDLCRVLVMQTFKDYGATQSFMFELHPDATYSLIAAYGVAPEFPNGHENMSLSATFPSATCIRTNSIVKTTKETVATEYPDTLSVPNQPLYEHLTIFPLRKFGLPIGACSILSADEISSGNGEDFLELVALLVETRFSKSGQYREISIDRAIYPNKSKVLTDREALIQIGMSKGFTNAQIAEELGFSHSTIRQDAILLFNKLGVSNRRDAGRLIS